MIRKSYSHYKKKPENDWSQYEECESCGAWKGKPCWNRTQASESRKTMKRPHKGRKKKK